MATGNESPAANLRRRRYCLLTSLSSGSSTAAMHWASILIVFLKKVTKSDQIWWIQKTRLCKLIENQKLTKSCLCPGRESNPHGRFGPRDFRTTVAFAIRRASRRACLGSGLFLHHRTGSIRCVVSSLCTFLLPEAWLKITISMTC